jgi:hypothetical protein
MITGDSPKMITVSAYGDSEIRGSAVSLLNIRIWVRIGSARCAAGALTGAEWPADAGDRFG